MRAITAIGLSGLLLAAACLKPSGALQADSKQSAVSANQQALDEISKSVILGGKAESEKAAVQLRELGKRDLTQKERDTWVRLARDTAIRNGDLKWLASLRDVPESFAPDSLYAILLAYVKLTKADTTGATAILDDLGDGHGLNPREQRRLYALRARIAQLKGNPREERANIEKIVDHLPDWPQQICQSCHASFSEKTKMTGLPIKELWFGARFVELMQKQGDAEAVRALAAAQLQQSPTNDRARIRQAFALQALGKSAEADKLFRELPWAKFAGRDLAQPHMLSAFP